MKISKAVQFSLGIFLAVATMMGEPSPGAPAGKLEGITAVSSKVSSDYVRSRQPDGTFLAEYYSFGDGGSWGGEIKDATIDTLKFVDVAHVIAEPLAGQNYLPARDPSKTKLLIMVYWGTTAIPLKPEESPMYLNYQQSLAEYRLLMDQKLYAEADAVLTSGLKQLSLANHITDMQDFKNAHMLGYDSDGLIGTDYGKYISHTALGLNERDEVAEIEDNRYFVVLMAYDFQLMWKQKKHKLLWETRFSISERRNTFDAALPVMARYASKYFGQPTNGLLRNRVLDGHVEIGDVKSLGEVDGSGK
jgi:hypothetical protein